MHNCGNMPALYVRDILGSGVIPIRFINIDVALPTSFLIFRNVIFPIKCYLPAKFQLFVIFSKKMQAMPEFYIPTCYFCGWTRKKR